MLGLIDNHALTPQSQTIENKKKICTLFYEISHMVWLATRPEATISLKRTLAVSVCLECMSLFNFLWQ